MSSLPVPRMTVAEYLAIERAAEYRSEFVDGVMYPMQGPGPGGARGMAGASRSHNRIKENLSIEIGSRLKGTACESYSSDQRVRLDRPGPFFYPDLLIVCGQFQSDAEDADALLNPQVVIEVLSPSTAGYDRGIKFRYYRKMASVKEYVLVSRDRVRVERMVRGPDDVWAETAFDDPAGEFALETVPVRVPLADVYRGVTLPGAPSS